MLRMNFLYHARMPTSPTQLRKLNLLMKNMSCSQKLPKKCSKWTLSWDYSVKLLFPYSTTDLLMFRLKIMSFGTC